MIPTEWVGQVWMGMYEKERKMIKRKLLGTKRTVGPMN